MKDRFRNNCSLFRPHHHHSSQVSDFGFSKVLNLNECQSSGSFFDMRRSYLQCVGTPLYMAPEIWGGGSEQQQVSKAADVYSFGVIMWEVIHGKTAWAQYLNESGLPPKMLATNYKAMMAFRPKFSAHLVEEAEELPTSATEPGMVALANLCRQCLEEDPSRRPGFPEIKDILSTLVQDLG